MTKPPSLVPYTYLPVDDLVVPVGLAGACPRKAPMSYELVGSVSPGLRGYGAVDEFPSHTAAMNKIAAQQKASLALAAKKVLAKTTAKTATVSTAGIKPNLSALKQVAPAIKLVKLTEVPTTVKPKLELEIVQQANAQDPTAPAIDVRDLLIDGSGGPQLDFTAYPEPEAAPDHTMAYVAAGLLLAAGVAVVFLSKKGK